MRPEDVSVQIGINNFSCRDRWYREDNTENSKYAAKNNNPENDLYRMQIYRLGNYCKSDFTKKITYFHQCELYFVCHYTDRALHNQDCAGTLVSLLKNDFVRLKLSHVHFGA